MSRDEMLKALEDMGFDMSAVNEGVPDALLAEFVSKLQDAGNDQPAPDEAPPDEPAPDEPPPPDDTQPEETPPANPDEQHAEGSLLGKPGSGANLHPLLRGSGQSALISRAKNPPAPHANPLVGKPTAGSMVQHAEDAAGNSDQEAGGGDPEHLGGGEHDDAVHEMLRGYGVGDDELSQMSEDDKCDRLLQHLEADHGDEEDGEHVQDQEIHDKDKEIQMHAEFFSEVRRVLPELISEAVDAKFAEIQATLGSAQTVATRLENDTRWKQIETFCEKLRDEGRLLPIEFTPTVARLKRADNLNSIERFDEKGTSTGAKTELELQMAELASKPILLRFSERVKVGEDPAYNPERKKLEDHFEVFSEKLKRNGVTKEKLVAAFEIARAKNPQLTAAEFTSAAG